MLSREETGAILLTALSRGGDFAEIFMEKRRPTIISLDDGKIEELITGTDRGTGIRVTAGGQTHFMSSNRVDNEGLLKMADSLARSIGQRRVVEEIRFPLRETGPKAFSFVEIPVESVATSRKIALLRRADKAARAYDPRIVQVSCIYGDLVQDIFIANSENVFETDKRVYPRLIVIATAKDNGSIHTGMERVYGTCGFELFDDNPPEKIAEEAARLAIFQLEAKPAPAGTYKVVIMGQAGGGVLIHEAVGHGLEADLVEQGVSCYAGKIGQKVASELITVIDDRTILNKRGTAKIDDEGSPCEETVLIKDGILVGYLQDRKMARRHGVQQNGHGRRESFRFVPIPRMGNTMIAPGKTPPAQILNLLKEGIIIAKMGGAGQVDTASGNFIFSVTEAYLVKHDDGSKIIEPIRGATLVGNGPKVLLEEIIMVGSDLGFDGGTCGKGQLVPVGDALPTVMIRQIVIGGLAEKEKGNG